MQPLQHRFWILPKDHGFSDLTKLFSDRFIVRSGSINKRSRVWYDTFDWRLIRKKQRLTHDGTYWVLEDFQGRQLAALQSPQKSFRFSWQFPDSSLRQCLEKSLDVRGLLQIGTEELGSCSLALCNHDEKIVVFLDMQLSTNKQIDKQRRIVHIKEMRGYGKYFKRAEKILNNSGAVPVNNMNDLFSFVLEGTGRIPLDYNSRYLVPLRPETKSIDAIRQIHTFLLTCVRRNEEGVIADLDTEFLHDLRVAVRRTRSALALLKGVLTTDITDRFKENFRYIGQITGPVRDLDVYLLNKQKYMDSVPERLQQGLTYFFENLAESRKEEQRKLVISLRGSHYQQILTDWSQLLDGESPLPAGEKGDIPIAVLGGKIIHKRFRRVLEDGRRIHRGTPDNKLHKLRIQCKKLRYCLEFFASLYDSKQMKQFIRQLKMLQNNLGDFNDLSVQQEVLAKYLSTIRPGSRKSQELAASIGGLMANLAAQHRWTRTHFEKTFSHFCCPKNMTLYREIFD